MSQAPKRKAHRAKLPSFRLLFPSLLVPFASRRAVLVLCLNLGRTYTFHCRRKRQAAFEMVGLCCQCSVLVYYDHDSQSAGPKFEFPANMDDLLRRFHRTHSDPEIRKEIEDIQHILIALNDSDRSATKSFFFSRKIAAQDFSWRCHLLKSIIVGIVTSELIPKRKEQPMNSFVHGTGADWNLDCAV